MALVFAALIVAGLFWTAIVLAIFHFDVDSDSDYPPFRQLVNAAGITGIGAGLLLSYLAGFEDIALVVACTVGAAVAVAIVYAVVLPWLRRRRDAATSTPPGRPPSSPPTS